MLSGNFTQKMGKSGRVIVPKKLRDGFGNGVVVIAGCKDHIEIWDKEQWAKEQVKMRKTLDRILN